MTIKIVLPEGKGPRDAGGTKVFTDSGHEIEGVTRIQCDWRVNDILEATITVQVSEIENLRGIEGVVVAETRPEVEYVPLTTGITEWKHGTITYPDGDEE